MKVFLGSILILITAVAALTTANPSWLNLTGSENNRYRYKLDVPANTPYEMAYYVERLKQNDFDIAGYSWQDKQIEIITDDEGLKKLETLKLKGKILETFNSHSTSGIMDDFVRVDPQYLTPDKVTAKLKDLNARYPNLTRLEQIGTSNQGLPIWAFLISNTPDTKSSDYYEKPSIIFDGMHHARELMTSEVVMDVADFLLSSEVRNNKQWQLLLDKWNVWIVPMLNVDGRNIVTTQDKWWRKNARTENGKTFGVDINRNYSFNWNKCNGSSGNRNNDTYRGSSGNSEPESQALVSLAEKVVPTASLSYHSFSELIIYPYGCKGIFTGENVLLSRIANELAALLPSDKGTGNYATGTPWQLLYSVDGDSSSYMFGKFGAVSYTFEINLEFQPLYSLKQPTIAKHRKAWAYFLNRLSNNLFSLKIIDGKTGQPTEAEIRIANIVLNQGETPYRSNLAGNYFKVLDPGKYTFGVTLKDGRTAQFEVEMNGAPQEKQITIE